MPFTTTYDCSFNQQTKNGHVFLPLQIIYFVDQSSNPIIKNDKNYIYICKYVNKCICIYKYM